MKIISKLLTLAVFFVTATAFATEKKSLSVSDLVDQYYAQKKSSSRLFTHKRLPPIDCDPQNPYPDTQSCMDEACKRLGHFGCDDISELKEVSKACRGNYGSQCLQTVCDKLGHFGCDDMREIQSVTRACVGNYDMGCFDSICKKLGHFGCDDMREAEEVLNTCSGNDFR